MSSWSYASHFMGGYWEVEPMGNRQYRVRYIAYSDCSGDNPSISLTTNVALQTSCGNMSNMSLRFDSGSEIEVTQNCTGTPFISCETTNSGVKQIIYRLKDESSNDIITIPLGCQSFSLFFTNHSRNDVVNYINYTNEDFRSEFTYYLNTPDNHCSIQKGKAVLFARSQNTKGMNRFRWYNDGQIQASSAKTASMTNTEMANETKANLSIYPNPARKEVSIQGVEPDQEVQILNVYSQEVWNGKVNVQNKIYFELPDGMYLLKVANHTFKLTINQ